MSNSLKVVCIISDINIRNLLTDLIDSMENVVVTGATGSTEKGMTMVEESNPDAIIIGETLRDRNGMEFAGYIMENRPSNAVILVASSPRDDLYKEAMRAGIKEIIFPPFNREEIRTSIIRAGKIHQKFAHSTTEQSFSKGSGKEKKNGRILSFFSTKGGVGKTIISSNLAVLLANKGKKTVLLDMDMFFGDVAWAMDIMPDINVVDLVNDNQEINLSTIEKYMFKHQSGAYVLPAPIKLGNEDFVKAEHINLILGILQEEYDFVLIDCPSYINDSVLMALDSSETIILITTMDIFAVNNLKSCINAFREAGYSRTKFRLVINRFFKGAGIGEKDIAAALGIPVSAVLPQDDGIITSSINQGIPAVTAFKKSGFSKSLSGFAEIISENSGKST